MLAKNPEFSDSAFVRAEALSASDKISLLQACEAERVLPEADLLDIFSKFLRVPAANLSEMEIPQQIIQLIPEDMARKLIVVPIDKAGNNLIVAVNEPRNLSIMHSIQMATGFMPKPVLALTSQLQASIERYYSEGNVRLSTEGEAGGGAGSAQAQPQKPKSGVQGPSRIDILADRADGPAARLVNQVLQKCIDTKASDIHIECYETDMRVRLRIDGVLHEIGDINLAMRESVIARVKIMSALNIAEKRLPQDGAINISYNGRPIDFRVSCLPTLFGEKIVMRILDRSNLQVDMEKLGFEADQLEIFKSSIYSPNGMVLVTGPTGSGKTTTLYSALAELNQTTDNIMTAEDPVEYSLRGINQVQMKNDIGMNFASALKAFLRQDPDVVMIGEIRDLETGEIAVKAALTGHMVLSTLHTNSAPDTVSRLLNMGIEGFNLASALTCVTAQRLLKKICEKCRVVDETVNAASMKELGIHPDFAARVVSYKGAGCQFCNGTGTKGRVAIHEVMRVSDPIRDAILANKPASIIKNIAMVNGMRSLRGSALGKMVQGLVSAQEVSASTAPDVSPGKAA